MNQLQTIIEVVEVNGKSSRVITNLNSPRSIWVKTKDISEDVVNAVVLEEKVELSDFWKDVEKRIGMDVCTPFMNRFPNDSFVAYDNNTVWSKSLLTIFKTKKGITIARAAMPLSCQYIVNFGDKI